MFSVTMRCFRQKSLQVDYTTLQSITLNAQISAPDRQISAKAPPALTAFTNRSSMVKCSNVIFFSVCVIS